MPDIWFVVGIIVICIAFMLVLYSIVRRWRISCSAARPASNFSNISAFPLIFDLSFKDPSSVLRNIWIGMEHNDIRRNLRITYEDT